MNRNIRPILLEPAISRVEVCCSPAFTYCMKCEGSKKKNRVEYVQKFSVVEEQVGFSSTVIVSDCIV